MPARPVYQAHTRWVGGTDMVWRKGRVPRLISRVRAEAVDVLQVNVGYRCNLECRHCHVNAGPQRREAMPAEVMEQCVKVFSAPSIDTLDITGGSPELHPRLRWLLDRCAPLGRRLVVRTNGVILLEKGYETFIDLYARNHVAVVLSLPHMEPGVTERQRGHGRPLLPLYRRRGKFLPGRSGVGQA